MKPNAQPGKSPEGGGVQHLLFGALCRDLSTTIQVSKALSRNKYGNLHNGLICYISDPAYHPFHEQTLGEFSQFFEHGDCFGSMFERICASLRTKQSIDGAEKQEN